MKLTVTDAKAKEVRSVYLDGKRMLTPVAFDTEEGWVDYIDPDLSNIEVQADSGIRKQDDKFVQDRPPQAAVDALPPEMRHVVRRKEGKVYVVFQDGSVVPPVEE